MRWNARSPSGQYLHPFASPVISTAGVPAGTYQWACHQGIQAYGASASNTFGATNVAVEISLRNDMPLDSDGQLDALRVYDNAGNPRYAVGKSAHAQISWLSTIGDTFLSREADLAGELAWNRVLSISKNPDAVTPDTSRDAATDRKQRRKESCTTPCKR